MNLFPVDLVIAEKAKSLEAGSTTVLSAELVLMMIVSTWTIVFLGMIPLLFCSTVA